MATTPDQRIGAAVRTELLLQHRTMTEVAREVFDAPVWVMQSRCSGRTPFGAWELVQVADYLRVDVVQFLAAAKQPSPGSGAPASTEFHDGRASYDNPVVDVVFNAPAACLAA